MNNTVRQTFWICKSLGSCIIATPWKWNYRLASFWCQIIGLCRTTRIINYYLKNINLLLSSIVKFTLACGSGLFLDKGRFWPIYGLWPHVTTGDTWIVEAVSSDDSKETGSLRVATSDNDKEVDSSTVVTSNDGKEAGSSRNIWWQQGSWLIKNCNIRWQ